MGYIYQRRNHGRKVLAKAKDAICTNIISHVNSNESNNLQTLNIDNVKITSNCPYLAVKIGSSSNKSINLPNIIDTESSVCINDKITVSNDINKENSSHQSSLEIIYHLCNDSGVNLYNTEEEVDVKFVQFVY